MFDEELEKAILYHLIFNKEQDTLNEEDFINQTNKEIIIAINELNKANEEISLISIKTKIENKGKRIANLIGYMSTFDAYALGTTYNDISKKLKEFTKKRKIYNCLEDNIKVIGSESEIDILAQNLVNDIDKIVSTEQDRNSLSDKLNETLLNIEERYHSRNDTSYRTGIIDLDSMTLGLHPQELTIIGARPGVGKTTFALQIASKIAKNKDVLFVSLEMSDTQILEKIIAREQNIDSFRLRSGYLDDNDFKKIVTGCSMISDLNLDINSKIRTIQELEVVAKKKKNKGNLGLIVIDYIQLLKNRGSFGSREQEVADISRRLKLLSLDLNIPVIALCQLNRNADSGEPSLADLRESGSIEQDADNIIFLYKDEKAEPQINLKLAKQRAGSTGYVKLLFDRQKSKFLNLERRM